jgi:hypothetical protein
MVEESLVDGRKGSVVEGVVKVDSFHLSANPASESFDGNLLLH